MKPTKSILCHRSNSSSSPRAPLAASVPLTLSLSLCFLLSLSRARSPLLLRRRSVRGMPPFVPPPSRSPAQNFSPVTPAESLPVSGLNFPLARLTTARETSTISHEETSFLPAVFRDTPPCFLASRWARSSGFHGPTERVQHFAVGSIPGCGRCRLATRNSYLLFYSWGYAPNA